MIRQLTPDDQQHLRRLAYMAAYNPDPANQGPEIDKAVEVWTHDFGAQAGDMGVCSEEGGVHGVCWVRFREPALVEGAPQLLIAVDMMQRGRGVEKELLEATLGLCDRMGVEKVSLLVNPSQREELLLYSTHNFQHQGTTEMGNMIMVRPRQAVDA